MKSLVAKEIRLILPMYAVALLLATSPAWPIYPNYEYGFSHEIRFPEFAGFAMCLGMVLVALVSFGREFNLRTFSLMMSQPVSRARIWRTKLAVLGIALAVLFLVWSSQCLRIWSFSKWWMAVDVASGWTNGRQVLSGMALDGLMIFAGALWATLLVRQMIAAFWLAVFTPLLIALITLKETDGPAKTFAVLGLYSITGFIAARWLFFRAQDVAWTGGVISLGNLVAGRSRIQTGSRMHRFQPLKTLFWKEVRLQEITLAGMAGLFVLHLGVVLVRKNWHAGNEISSGLLRFALENFAVFWLTSPLFAGCASVAEERRMGTMDGQLCLPVSCRSQMAIKLGVTLLLGGVLALLLLLLAEGFGSAIGARNEHAAKETFSRLIKTRTRSCCICWLSRDFHCCRFMRPPWRGTSFRAWSRRWARRWASFS